MSTTFRRCGAALALGLGVLALGASADAQPSLNLRNFYPSSDPSATLYLERANTPAPKSFNAAMWLSYANQPLVLRDGSGNKLAGVVDHQLSLDTSFGYTLLKDLSVGVVIPAVIYQSGESNATTAAILGDASIPLQAMGDAQLQTKFNLIPTGELGGFGLALLGRASIPTGDESSTLGEGQVVPTARILGEFAAVGASAQATLGFKWRPSERTFANRTWGNAIPWGVAVGLKPQMFGWDKSGNWGFNAEVHGFLPAGPDAPFTSASQSPAFAGLSATYQMRDIRILAGFENAISSGAGAPLMRGVLAIGWAPRSHDQDGDGVEDDVDECPPLPEDKDGFQDLDGCPEADNDDDGVADADDQCPTQEEDKDDFQDEDGCPDPDNDKDGIVDDEDACPDTPGPASSNEEENGCKPEDPDGDGISGSADKCPNQPEDKDGFEDSDGCPDLDNDKDGVADTQDACPLKAGKAFEQASMRGCPSPDRDMDGWPDKADKCPDQPEVYNGIKDDDGCPDGSKFGRQSMLNIKRKKGLDVAFVRPLRFKNNRSAELTKVSQHQLRNLAQELFKHPEWSVVVSIQARKVGGDDLAQKRAQSVQSFVQASALRGASVSVSPWSAGKVSRQGKFSGISVLVLEPPAPPKPVESNTPAPTKPGVAKKVTPAKKALPAKKPAAKKP